MIPRSLLLASGAVAILCAAGLGWSAAPPPASAFAHPAPEVNACDFLTTEDVSDVLKANVRPGERSDDGATNVGSYSSTCFWRVNPAAESTPDTRSARPVYAILNMMSWPAGSGMSGKFLQDFREAEKKDLIPEKTVPLKIGDEALSWGDGVAVRKGDLSFGISVAFKPGDHSISGPMQEALARKVIERLQRDVHHQATGI